MKRILTAPALLLAACASPEAAPEPETIGLETATGTAVALGTYAFWTLDCTAVPVQIETVEVPARGIIDIAQADYTIPETVPEGAPEGCAGRTIEGKALRYLPDGEWQGTDRLTVIARGAGQSVSDSFEITVR